MTRCFDKSIKNWCSVASWVVGIYAWCTIWNFFDLTWPQWPPSERMPYLGEKLDFWWSIPQKITSTGKSLSEAFLFTEHWENMLCTKIVLNVRNNFCTQHVLPRFKLGIFMYWTCNSVNNLLSYCGLINKSFWQRFTCTSSI